MKPNLFQVVVIAQRAAASLFGSRFAIVGARYASAVRILLVSAITSQVGSCCFIDTVESALTVTACSADFAEFRKTRTSFPATSTWAEKASPSGTPGPVVNTPRLVRHGLDAGQRVLDALRECEEIASTGEARQGLDVGQPDFSQEGILLVAELGRLLENSGRSSEEGPCTQIVVVDSSAT